jgi:transcription initiation factor TFIIE subunit alpha
MHENHTNDIESAGDMGAVYPRKQLDCTLVQILSEIGGENCVKVAEELYNISKSEITDEELAEICDINKNVVRKILYILSENKLSDFRKEKEKKKNWWIYYWRDNFDNLRNFIKLKREQVLEKLSLRMEYEDNNVFHRCVNEECRYLAPFEEAMEIDFRCPHCESALDHYDNVEVKEFLREQIALLRENIKNCV